MNNPSDQTRKPDVEEAETLAADAGGSDHADDRYAEDSDGYAEEERSGGSSFAATALKYVVLILVIFGFALWLVPMAAPYVPTSIAQHIMPGQQITEARFAAIEEKLDTASQVSDSDLTEMRQEIAALREELAAAKEAVATAQADAAAAREAADASAGAANSVSVSEDVVTSAQAAAKEAADAADTATAAATEAGKVASAATRDTASLARQMTSFEGRLAGLKSEIEAIGTNLAEAAQGDGASSGDVQAALAALKAKVDALAEREPDLAAYIRRDESDGFATQDDLRSARTALGAELSAALAALPGGGALATPADLSNLDGKVEGQVSALTDRLAAAETRTDEAVSAAEAASAAAAEAEAAATEAVNTVEGAIRGASLKAAAAALTSRLASGLPFDGALEEMTGLTGSDAPEALSTVAATGLPTGDQLSRRFPPLAAKAIAADLKASAGDGTIDQATARLESLFAGRPKGAQEGDTAGAVLSRVEDALNSGNLAVALGEADTLSDAAKAALGAWLDDLNARVAAEAAAAAFIADTGASQG